MGRNDGTDQAKRKVRSPIDTVWRLTVQKMIVVKQLYKIHGRGTDRVLVVSEYVYGWQRWSHKWSDRLHLTVRHARYQIGQKGTCDIELKFDR